MDGSLVEPQRISQNIAMQAISWRDDQKLPDDIKQPGLSQAEHCRKSSFDSKRIQDSISKLADTVCVLAPPPSVAPSSLGKVNIFCT